MHHALAGSLALLFRAAAAACQAQPLHVAVAPPRELADLTVEQIGNVEVTSVSGRSESLKQAAASIFVITQQGIRRSGATSLAQALRLAPNLQVAQTSAGQWAASARGFQDSISIEPGSAVGASRSDRGWLVQATCQP